jgi:copper chaperone CopZ
MAGMKLQKIILVTIALFLITVSAYGAELQRATFTVQNVSCRSCLSRIETELKKVPGIVGMSSDLQEGVLFIDHDSVVSAEQIINVIGMAGYTANIVESSMVDQSEVYYFSNTPVGRCGTGGCSTKGCSASGAAWKELYKRFISRAAK